MPSVAWSCEYRERTEELERASLSSWATLALETKGRDRYEEPDPLRTVFQADRDRIAASDGWRALAGKAAWLPAGSARTRLAEAMEVVAVARCLSRALRVNEDLTEAIAMAQPLGSTPFATAGEEALGLALEEPYRHEEHALTVVERLEGAGMGLNLTWETRDGLLHQAWEGPRAATLEGEVARFARHIVTSSAIVQRLRSAPSAVVPHGLADVLDDSHGARLDRATADVADRSSDRPELSLGAALTDCYAQARAAEARWLESDPAFASRHARAVHCVASVAVYHRTGGREPLSSAETVARVAGSTDAELIATYRAQYEPTGA